MLEAMKKSNQKMIIKVINNLFGRRKLQGIFEFLFNISLKGLNYGNGGDFKSSGELNVLNFVKEQFKSEKLITIFDVGGNDGCYSKTLSDFFSTKAIIHSFEPSKKTYEMFLEYTKNIPNIIPNNFGFSDVENYQILYTNEDGSGLASIYERKLDHFGISLDKKEEIKLSTIDAYCKKNGINRIHFLKLDIEGHELNALKGAAQMINETQIDIIQFEFGGCNIDSRTYFQDFYYLLKDSYKIYRILKDGLFEMPTYKETYEIFTIINYLAVKR